MYYWIAVCADNVHCVLAAKKPEDLNWAYLGAAQFVVTNGIRFCSVTGARWADPGEPLSSWSDFKEWGETAESFELMNDGGDKSIEVRFDGDELVPEDGCDYGDCWFVDWDEDRINPIRGR